MFGREWVTLFAAVDQVIPSIAVGVEVQRLREVLCVLLSFVLFELSVHEVQEEKGNWKGITKMKER